MGIQELGIVTGGLSARSGCAAGDVCKLQIPNSSRDGVLLSQNCVTRLVNASPPRAGFFLRALSSVMGWCWVLRLSQAHLGMALLVSSP